MTEHPSAETGKRGRSKSQGTEAERRPRACPESVGSPSPVVDRKGVEQAREIQGPPHAHCHHHLPSKHLSSGKGAQWKPLLRKPGTPLLPRPVLVSACPRREVTPSEGIAMTPSHDGQIPQPEPLTQPNPLRGSCLLVLPGPAAHLLLDGAPCLLTQPEPAWSFCNKGPALPVKNRTPLAPEINCIRLPACGLTSLSLPSQHEASGSL